MVVNFLSRTFLVVALLSSFCCGAQSHPGDAVLGKWMNVENTLTIEVYKSGEDFKAKIIWFRDKDNKNIPMDQRKDVHNPNEALRDRKIIGTDIVRNLVYNPAEKRWEKGIIYDATSGREWSSVASISDDNILKVRGYWKFEWIGKTIKFKRV